jgi:hypothetical protein
METNNKGPKIKMVIDNDKSSLYERDNVLTKAFNYLAAIFLTMLPKKMGSALIDRTSTKVKEIKDNATTYYALDTMYTTHKFSSEKGIIKGAMEYLWFKLGNPRAVRNRLKLVKKLIKEAIQKRIDFNAGKKTTIISLGCGSARAVIETILALCNENKTTIDNLDIKLLDKSSAAITLSKKIIHSCQFNETHFTFIEDKIRNFDQYLNNNEPDIIEMVGVMDYLSDEKAIEVLRKIYSNLPPGGYFITANINNNIEKVFITKTMNWSMIYRNPTELHRILHEAGFDETKTKIIYEPMKIHGVAICQK